ncbi:hypothetical protein BDN67DRAFT_1015181 [Paxillus ammoniavirescens]|nr:hypothetical protein BDN67DRAFT_1015181 [Paxillus ammoniavirescens]
MTKAAMAINAPAAVPAMAAMETSDEDVCVWDGLWVWDTDDSCIDIGFYRGNQPLIPDIFVTVKGQFELDTCALLLSQPTCVVHLRLAQISSGGPVNMLTEYLRPYFPYGAFYEINLEFDIATKAKMKLYLTFAVEAAASLEQAGLKNAIFAITNHSEDDTGDLFLGMFKGTNIANDVGEVLDVLLGPFQALTSGALLLLFACGSVVTMEKPFCMLQEAVKCYGFGSTIAFDTTHLHPPVTAHFVLSLIERTFVQHYPVHMAVEAALGVSGQLGLHSNVLLMMLETTDDGQSVLVVKYSWAHGNIRPWDNTLPIQCTNCGTIQSKWTRVVGDRRTWRGTLPVHI